MGHLIRSQAASRCLASPDRFSREEQWGREGGQVFDAPNLDVRDSYVIQKALTPKIYKIFQKGFPPIIHSKYKKGFKYVKYWYRKVNPFDPINP